jgi:hypothetical protein
MVYLAVTKLVEKSRTQYFIQHENAVTKSIIRKSAGQLAGRIMHLDVECAL